MPEQNSGSYIFWQHCFSSRDCMLCRMKVEYESECVARILKDVYMYYLKVQYQHSLEKLKKILILWKPCQVWQRLEPHVSQIAGFQNIKGLYKFFYEWIWWHFIRCCCRNSFGFWQLIDTIPKKWAEKFGKLHDKHLHHDPGSVSVKKCSIQEV